MLQCGAPDVRDRGDHKVERLRTVSDGGETTGCDPKRLAGTAGCSEHRQQDMRGLHLVRRTGTGCRQTETVAKMADKRQWLDALDRERQIICEAFGRVSVEPSARHRSEKRITERVAQRAQACAFRRCGSIRQRQCDTHADNARGIEGAGSQATLLAAAEQNGREARPGPA